MLAVFGHRRQNGRLGRSAPNGGALTEAIADAAHRLDESPRATQLAAQSLDVRINGSRRQLRIEAPDVTEQSATRLRTIAALDERDEQLELERSQIDVRPIDTDAVSLAIDTELSDYKNLLSGWPAASAQDRFDPQKQLADVERLDHEVVPADHEPRGAVDLFGSRRDDDDGYWARLRVASKLLGHA